MVSIKDAPRVQLLEIGVSAWENARYYTTVNGDTFEFDSTAPLANEINYRNDGFPDGVYIPMRSLPPPDYRVVWHKDG